MLSANIPPYFGGIGNACYRNAVGLAGFGHKVTVFSRKYEKAFNYAKNIKVVQLKPVFCFGNAVFLPQLLWKLGGFDVLHAHAPFHFGLEAAFVVSKLKKIPLVVSYQMDLVGAGWLKWFFRLHEALCVKPIIKRADAVIVSSFDYAENSNLSTIFAELKKDKKLFAVPNGVDLQEFSPGNDGSSIKKRFCKSGEPLVLFVGALDKAHYFKGVDFLLESVSEIKGKSFSLAVVGDGDLRKQFEEKASALGLRGKVFFAGRVEQKELPGYYSACDFLVLPSIDKGEAFGIVLAEAMASEKPVLASSLPGIRAIVEDKKNGLLFKARDKKDFLEKFLWLLENSGKAIAFGKAGREKAIKDLGWESIAKKIEGILLKVKT